MAKKKVSLIDYLRSGNEEEASSEKKTLNGRLSVAEFDSIHIENREGVGRDEGVQGEDFEHLQGGDQSAAALFDDMAD